MQSGAWVERAARRAAPGTSCSPARRSTSKRAARSPITAGSSAPTGPRRPSGAWCGYAAGRPRLHLVEVTQGAFARRIRSSPAEVDDDDPRRDAAQSHRHAPAPCGAAAGPRQPRQAGRLARGARSAPVRLRPLHRGHAPNSCWRSSGSSTSTSVLNTAGEHRSAVHRGGDRGGRDGAVRREVRRSRARRLGAGLQPGAVRRHARAGDRRHRTSSSSPRRAASPPACAASRR